MTALWVFDILATFGAFSALAYRLLMSQRPKRYICPDTLSWLAFGAAHFIALASVTTRLVRLSMGLHPLQVNTSLFYLVIAIVILIPVPHYDDRT